MLVLTPTSSFNESVNSTLGTIRNKHRQSLKFSTTRALLLVRYNSDLIDLDKEEDIRLIKNLLEQEDETEARKKKRPAC